jgi:glycosyltransferase involved in cell wall biosynthesis
LEAIQTYKPFFSIVIPTFGSPASLQGAIQSVLAQTYDNYQIIIVDDNDPLSNYRKETEVMVYGISNQERLTYIKQIKNSGPAASRNLGIENAQGEYIAFLDADDFWLDDYLATIVDLINKYPTAAGYATSFKIKDESNTYINQPEILASMTEGLLLNYFHFLEMDILPFWTGSICIKKEVFIRNGSFNINLRRGQDIEMWIRIYLNHDIAYTPLQKAVYNLGTSSMNGKVEQLLQAEYIYITHLNHFCQVNNGSIYYKDFQRYIDRKFLNLSKQFLLFDKNHNALELLRNKNTFNLERITLLISFYIVPISLLKTFNNLKYSIKRRLSRQ